MTVSTDFDPDAFLIVPARTFEDLRIGEVFRAPSRTLTDAHAAAFQTVSMDNHPVHYDAEWARTHGHVAPVVHGLQVLAFTAPGATLFPHFIARCSSASLSSPAPSWSRCTPGTPLYPALTITAWSPRLTTASWSRRSPSTTSAGNSCCRASTSTCCGVSGLYETAMAEHLARDQRGPETAGKGMNHGRTAQLCRRTTLCWAT
jgi:hypothetical protein